MATTGGAALDSALSRVGDRWSLLIVDALLAGPRRFGELQEEMPGIAPNVLSARLKHLEREGVVVARPYSRRPPRSSYELTAAGVELGGALRLLSQWGAAGGAEPLRHPSCGTPLEARWFCPTCDRAVEEHEGSGLRFL